nr:uncharacterized protein SMIM43 isoform X6 [Pan paniscus]
MQFSHFRTKSKSRAAALDWCSGDHSCNDSLGLQKEGWNNGRWKLSANAPLVSMNLTCPSFFLDKRLLKSQGVQNGFRSCQDNLGCCTNFQTWHSCRCRTDAIWCDSTE